MHLDASRDNPAKLRGHTAVLNVMRCAQYYYGHMSTLVCIKIYTNASVTGIYTFLCVWSVEITEAD